MICIVQWLQIIVQGYLYKNRYISYVLEEFVEYIVPQFNKENLKDHNLS